MSARDDGGPAFARAASVNPIEGGRLGAQLGMSLRDWFAGQALAGFISDPNCTTDTAKVARYCYNAADAMLKERAK